MDDAETRRKEFVAYEYKEVITDRGRVSFLLDGYENFGWEADGNIYEGAQGSFAPRKERKMVLRLKRNRKLVNKTELTRLQRNFESCVSEIETLERSKTSGATMAALITGIFGTAFMAGSTFAVTAQPPNIILCILLALPGFIGWILPYFVYRRVLEKQTEKVNRIIEEKYEEIYTVCEKGNKLLY